MKSKLVVLMICLLFAGSMIPILPQSQQAHRFASASSSNELVIGTTTAPTPVEFNPVKMVTTYWMAETYASLIGWDSVGNYVPALAQNWTVSSDGKTVTYNLKPNLEWSDGQALNSSDVAFTFKLITEQAPLWYYLFAPIQTANSSTVTGQSSSNGSVVTPSATQVVFHLNSPAATFLIYAGGQPIYPKHYYESQNLTANNPTLSTMVGSGPFIPTSFTPGTEADYVANPHYYGGAPHLSQVIFKFFTDSTAAEIALEGGTINYLQGVPSTDVASISKTAGIKIATEEDQSNIYLVFNMHPKLSDNSTNPLFDIRVRKAIAMALDLPGILNSSFGGSQYYKLANQIEVPNMYYGGQPVQNTTIPSPEYPQNVTGAKALLAAAGYSSGFTISAVYLSGGEGSGSGTTLKYMQLIQSELATVGITLNLTPDDSTTFNNVVYSAAPPKAWNIALSVISESPDGDVAPFYMVSGLGGNAGAGGFNSGGYNDSTFNQLVALEENTTGVSQRIAIFQKIDGYIHQQLPVLELFYEVQIAAYSDQFQGFQFGLGNPWHDYWGSLKQQSLDNVSMVGATTNSTTTSTSATSSNSTTSSSFTSSSSSPSSSTTATTTSPVGSSSSTSAVAPSSDNTLLYVGIIVLIIVIIAGVALAMRRRGRPPAAPPP